MGAGVLCQDVAAPLAAIIVPVPVPVLYSQTFKNSDTAVWWGGGIIGEDKTAVGSSQEAKAPRRWIAVAREGSWRPVGWGARGWKLLAAKRVGLRLWL